MPSSPAFVSALPTVNVAGQDKPDKGKAGKAERSKGGGR